MTYNQNTFAAFHWLPEEDPFNIVEISSDDENDYRDAEIRYPDHEEEPPQDTEPSPEAQAASAAFRKAVGGSMPFYLAGPHERHQLRAVAVRLLELAAVAGARLEDVFIDANGLPAWPGRVWDPEAQTSLHDVVQARLRECWDGWAIGARLRGVLVHLGNERLAEARLLGVSLADLTVGEDLLPTWRGRDGDSGDDDDDTMMEDGSSVHSDDLPLLWSDGAEEEGAAADDGRLPSAWSSDSKSAPSESEYEDTSIILYDFVPSIPVIEEPDDDDDDEARYSNVVHNVDVLGASFPVDGPVDFGVYLVYDDDPDVAELPEVELAIDEEAFAYHHHLADAVDIELADGGLYFVHPQDD